MSRFRRYPYGLGDPGGGPDSLEDVIEELAEAARERGIDPGEIVAAADAMRPRAERSAMAARVAAAAGDGNWPVLPPAERFRGQNALPVFPTVVILPEQTDFPIYTNRERCLVIDSEDQASTQFRDQVIIPDWATVYAISGYALVKPADAWEDGQLSVTVQFTRDSGDQLSTAEVLWPAIVGTAENPMPIGTPGWPFMSNQSLTVSGNSDYDTYKLYLVFHTTESLAHTNVGMARTPEYTR